MRSQGESREHIVRWSAPHWCSETGRRWDDEGVFVDDAVQKVWILEGGKTTTSMVEASGVDV